VVGITELHKIIHAFPSQIDRVPGLNSGIPSLIRVIRVIRPIRGYSFPQIIRITRITRMIFPR